MIQGRVESRFQNFNIQEFKRWPLVDRCSGVIGPSRLRWLQPRRIPAAKIEPVVWDEVKKFVMSEEFVQNLLLRARGMQGPDDKETKSKGLDIKLKAINRQIELLAERMPTRPSAPPSRT